MNKKPIRYVRVNIRYKDKLLVQSYKLIKATGRYKDTNSKGIYASIKGRETSIFTAVRALKECLNLSINKSRLTLTGKFKESKSSIKDCEIKEYITYEYLLDISEQEFKSMNTQYETDKTTNFLTWE